MNSRDAVALVLSRPMAQWPAEPALPAADWLAVAADEGVVALVDARIRAAPAGVPVDIQRAFADAARADVARLMVRQAEARRVLARFAAAGLPVLLLKGSALAYWAYPEPHLRSCADVDLLFASRDQALAAAATLADDGYVVRQPFGDLATREFLCLRENGGARAVELDMHWSLSSAPLFADRLGFEELMAASIALPGLAPGALGLGPVHAVLHACMHRASDLANGGGEKLKWLYDLHLLTAGLDDADWRALSALAADRGLAGVCLDALEEAARLLGTALPDEAVAGLRTASERESLDPRRLRRWSYFQRQNLRALPDWTTRLRWLRQRLFPTADYRVEVGKDGVGLVGDRIRRALRQLRR
jgi:hypothetical protein